jgi:hypothetical protein
MRWSLTLCLDRRRRHAEDARAGCRGRAGIELLHDGGIRVAARRVVALVENQKLPSAEKTRTRKEQREVGEANGKGRREVHRSQKMALWTGMVKMGREWEGGREGEGGGAEGREGREGEGREEGSRLVFTLKAVRGAKPWLRTLRKICAVMTKMVAVLSSSIHCVWSWSRRAAMRDGIFVDGTPRPPPRLLRRKRKGGKWRVSTGGGGRRTVVAAVAFDGVAGVDAQRFALLHHQLPPVHDEDHAEAVQNFRRREMLCSGGPRRCSSGPRRWRWHGRTWRSRRLHVGTAGCGQLALLQFTLFQLGAL